VTRKTVWRGAEMTVTAATIGPSDASSATAVPDRNFIRTTRDPVTTAGVVNQEMRRG
jgi:hypothetical protein